MLEAIELLKNEGINAYELSAVLVVPCRGMDEFEDMVFKVERLFKYHKISVPWRVEPYKYERDQSIAAVMFGTKK